MSHLRLDRILLFALVVLVLVACGSSDSTERAADVDVTEPTPLATTAPVAVPVQAGDEVVADASLAGATTSSQPAQLATQAGTRDGVEAAQWGSNVSLEIGEGSFRYVSDGLPNHELPDQFLIPLEGNMPPFDGDDISAEFEIRDTDGLVVASPLDVQITLDPVYSEEVTQTSLSTIGVTISGAPLFNDYEDQTRINIALDDNISLDGVFFIDACNGHPLASGMSYHYHGVPYCVTDQVDVAGEHSTIIGVLLDGFPLYGSKDEGGVMLINADLDECSGHFGVTPEFPEGIYHYHLTEDANPYSIDCFHGEIDYGSAAGQGGPPAGGERPAGGPPTGGEEAGGPPPADGEAPAGGPPADGEAPAGGPPGDGDALADGEAPAGGPPADGDAPADGEAPAGGPPADGEAPADGAPGEGPPAGGGGAPDFAQAAAALGITKDALRTALGGPPPDFDAAAAALGISVEQLQAALDAAS